MYHVCSSIADFGMFQDMSVDPETMLQDNVPGCLPMDMFTIVDQGAVLSFKPFDQNGDRESIYFGFQGYGLVVLNDEYDHNPYHVLKLQIASVRGGDNSYTTVSILLSLTIRAHFKSQSTRNVCDPTKYHAVRLTSRVRSLHGWVEPTCADEFASNPQP